MSIKIVIECDGLDCVNSREIDEDTTENIEAHEWLCDPNESEYHYCPSCAPAVKDEWEAAPYIEM